MASGAHRPPRGRHGDPAGPQKGRKLPMDAWFEEYETPHQLRDLIVTLVIVVGIVAMLIAIGAI